MTSITALLSQRYGQDISADQFLSVATPVIDTMLQHRSVRHYLPDALAQGTLETLVAAGQSAATTSNLQLWSLVAVEDAQRKQQLSELVGNQKQVAQAPLFLAWLCDISRIRRLAAEAGKPSEASHYLESFLTCAIDAALAAQNVATAAESLGLGTVFIGGLRNKPSDVRALLNLPEGVFPVFGMVIGKPDPTRPAAVKPRLPLSAVLHREQYQPRPVKEEIGSIDAATVQFAQSQGMPADDWSSKITDRLAQPESLHGRQHLKEELHKAGFALR